MDNCVVRDPSAKGIDLFRVWFNNWLCAPTFTQSGPAAAYLQMLEEGRRKPEYCEGRP